MILIGTLVGAVTGFALDVGKQLIFNGWELKSVNLGSAFNSAIVGAALGFSFAMGVAYLGTAIAGTSIASGLTIGGAVVGPTVQLSVGAAFATSAIVSYMAGAAGYAVEEMWNGRTPTTEKANMHGSFVMLEGMMYYGVGGITGSVGNIGTKGKLLTTKEWWGKFFFGLEFTQPGKTLIDLIRKNIYL